MNQEDYSNYYIKDLLRDLGHDYNYIKEKIQLFLKLKRYFSIFQIVWSYITAVLFVLYGVRWLISTGDIVLPVVIFSISLIYAVVTTVLLAVGTSDDKQKKKNITLARRIFKYTSFAIKILIISLTMISFALGTEEVSVPVLIGIIFTVVWIVISVVIDISIFFINKMLKFLKEFAKREIDRTKAAVKNTFGPVAAPAAKVVNKAKGFISRWISKKTKTETLPQQEKKETDPFED
ncbi:MAG: hypothetical protein J6Y68_05230 [Clostridia bacterium]|nr:hypothetical protein [Clostridia bacterium]MBP5593586.1 hypothetical protein [Clostridia bacterium]